MKTRNASWRKKLLTSACAAICSLTMLSLTAIGQEVIFKGETCPLEITLQSEESVTLQVGRVEVLGVIDGMYAVVRCQDGDQTVVGRVGLTDLSAVVPALDISALPATSEWTDLTQGSSGEMVATVQKDLIALSYLSGTADGMMGGMTTAAITAFQQENGLAATGIVDVYTFLILRNTVSYKSDPIECDYPPVFDPKVKFASIIDHVADQSQLEAFAGPEWNFTYDVMKGEGELKNGTDGVFVGDWADTSREIDLLYMNIYAVVLLEQNDEGVIQPEPVFQILTNGSYRPYVDGLILKCGNEAVEMYSAASEGEIEGLEVKEVTSVPITEEAAKLLLTGSPDALLRVSGVNRTYDLDISAQLGEIRSYLKAVKSLIGTNDSEVMVQ